MNVVALPQDHETLLDPPDAAEAQFIAAGLLSAISLPDEPPQPLQALLISSMTQAMTGHPQLEGMAEEVSAAEFAAGLARRNLVFRTRVLQTAILAALIEHPVSPAVAARLAEYAGCLGVTDRMLVLAQEYAAGSRGLALVDFDRSGYTVEAVRAEIGVVAKSSASVAAGSVGPFEAGSKSPYQLNAGHQLAAERSHAYDGYGATVV